MSNFESNNNVEIITMVEEQKQPKKGCSEILGEIIGVAIWIGIIVWILSNSMLFCDDEPDVYFNGNCETLITIEYEEKILSKKPDAKIYLDNCKIGEISEGQSKSFILNLEEGEEYKLRIKKNFLSTKTAKIKITKNNKIFIYTFDGNDLTDEKEYNDMRN
ncbi:MAG: hypothetical protein IKJ60_00650 [Ruminococcus sp.]|nr:hypothetical protein [Ruminococcus sp.]